MFKNILLNTLKKVLLNQRKYIEEYVIEQNKKVLLNQCTYIEEYVIAYIEKYVAQLMNIT